MPEFSELDLGAYPYKNCAPMGPDNDSFVNVQSDPLVKHMPPVSN